ncbi:MAG: carbon-nitrogen hydrolase family protein [Pseudomonadota bacterium]
MVDDVKVACIQMNSGSDIEENLVEAGKLIQGAARDGAELIMTPENTDFIRKDNELTLKTAKNDDEHPGIPFFSELASKNRVWLLIGSMKIKVSATHVVNRSFLFRPTGQLMASYDKIHLFDVALQNDEKYKESDFVEPGAKAVVASTPWRKLGMTICYDVRFPYLYRTMAQAGADMIAVPSAFTEFTGKAHWETLLRARAIETGSFVMAPAQGGEHEGGRKTYGHSMIIDPWGNIMAHKEDYDPGFITADLDFLKVTKARFSVPSLMHDRKYDFYQTKNL